MGEIKCFISKTISNFPFERFFKPFDTYSYIVYELGSYVLTGFHVLNVK